MAITSFSATPCGNDVWRLAFESDASDPTFYVWRDAALWLSTMAGGVDVLVAPGTYPVFDVFDDAGAEPAASFPQRATLQWFGASGVGEYRVEQYVGAAWVRRARVPGRGVGYYRWASGVLDDCASQQFRVVAVGANGNESGPTGFVVLMVRNPDPPDVALSYDGVTGTVTISAA